MKKSTRKVMCRNVQIGGGAPVSIQSMTNTDTHDVEATLEQIKALENAGCQIIRIAVSDEGSIDAFRRIRERTDMPLVADIQFDYRMAIAAVEAGADKIRINPGNIGSIGRVKAVADACRARNIPIRVGVNSGSVEKDILEKYGGVTAEGLAESAMRYVELLEELDFEDIVVSVKASDVRLNYETNMILSEMTDHPIHIGVTESGDPERGSIKSAAGLGALLLSGTGDTIRVSLTGDPVKEIPAAREILKCTGYLDSGIDVVSCPTCSRCRTDLPGITGRIMAHVNRIEPQLIAKGLPKITLAVMGCAVNGPGEASGADLGAACGDKKGVIFRKGEIIGTVPESEIEETLIRELEAMIERKE